MQSTSSGIVSGAVEPVSDQWRKFVNRAVRFPTGMALLSRDAPPIRSTLAYKTGLAAFAFPSFTNARALMDTATSVSNASKK